MPIVSIVSKENPERAMRKFKRMVEREGIIKEWKKRQYFEKPSAIRNRQARSLQGKLKRNRRIPFNHSS